MMNFPVVNHHYHHVVAPTGAVAGPSISYTTTIPGQVLPYIHASYPGSNLPLSSYHHQQIQQHPLSPPVSSALYANGHFNPYVNHVSPSPLRIHLPVQQTIYPAAIQSNIHITHPQIIVQPTTKTNNEIHVSPAQLSHKLQAQHHVQPQHKQINANDHDQQHHHHENNNEQDEAYMKVKKQRNIRGNTKTMAMVMPPTATALSSSPLKFSVSDSDIDLHIHPSDVVTPIHSDHNEKCMGDSKSVVTTTASSSSSTMPDDDDGDVDEREFDDDEEEDDDGEFSVSLSKFGHGETAIAHKLNKRKRDSKDVCGGSNKKVDGILTNVLKKVCDNCIKLKKKCKKEPGSDQCETCEKKGLPCHFARQKKRGRVFGTVITTRIKRAPNEPLPPSATYDADYLASLQLKLGNCIQMLQQISEGESKDDPQ